MSNVSEDAKRYELMVIVTPEIGEAAIKKAVDKIRKHITGAKGEIFFEDQWGLRNLAYPIRKQDQGFYAVLDFMSEPDFIQEFDRILRLDTEVLRHMLQALPTYYQPLSIAAMDEAADAEMKKEQAEKDEKMAAKARPAVRKMEIPREAVTPKMEAKAEAPAMKAEDKDAPAAKKAAPKKKEETKQALEDIDAKLDSILQNPDINF